ncbi:MAG: hypothetical protein IKL53_10290 [Lachnospiraceae bacterium]|nr:hypothetical protein [Lachnospiraceae bacterium]
MFKINGIEGNYYRVFIYDENGNIVFQTERPSDMHISIDVPLRNARKINFAKGDCFDINSDGGQYMFFRNGKDLYIPTSVLKVIKVEEKVAFKCSGETNYKNYYTIVDANGTEYTVESDYYTRCEKTDERLYREKLAKIISSCLYSNKTVSHYEVEELLKKLDISIK